MRLTARIRAIEGRTAGRGCRVCREWQGSGIACVPSEAADDPDAWRRHLLHPATCPRCGRAVFQDVRVIVGVRWEDI